MHYDLEEGTGRDRYRLTVHEAVDTEPAWLRDDGIADAARRFDMADKDSFVLEQQG